ncbi:MAG TPA: UDP-N-acetylmuramate dehydrogenase [Acidobacteriaceae bacterium]|jgi:UDP-N-acetylmuramate dehydrogenase
MEFRQGVSLAPFTTFEIGGPAAWFADAASEEDIEVAVDFAASRELRLFVLGGGSNVLVSDAGFDGLVLHIALRGIEREGTVLSAAAGEDWDALVAHSVDAGLAGIECLSGIPGTVGGTPVQNVGAYGQEVSRTIRTVRAFDRAARAWGDLGNVDCGFAYRCSRFNHGADRDRFIVSRVTYRLEENVPAAVTYADLKHYFRGQNIAEPSLRQVRAAVLNIRLSKGMVVTPDNPERRSAGSFFKNPVIAASRLPQIAAAAGVPEADVPRYPVGAGQVKLPAAWLLERAGFVKGYRQGAAAVSTRHTLALTNRGGATAAEITALRDTIQSRARERFGISLEPEPVWVT